MNLEPSQKLRGPILEDKLFLQNFNLYYPVPNFTKST